MAIRKNGRVIPVFSFAVLVGIMLTLAPAVGASSDALHDAVVAYLKKGETGKAISLLMPEARRGEGQAQLDLGLVFYYGKHDIKNSAYWLMEAWKAGGDIRKAAAEDMAKIDTEAGYPTTADTFDRLMQIKTFVDRLPKQSGNAGETRNSDSDDTMMNHFMLHNFIERGHPLDFGGD